MFPFTLVRKESPRKAACDAYDCVAAGGRARACLPKVFLLTALPPSPSDTVQMLADHQYHRTGAGSL